MGVGSGPGRLINVGSENHREFCIAYGVARRKWVRGEVGLDEAEVVGGCQITKARERARTLSNGKYPLSNTHFNQIFSYMTDHKRLPHFRPNQCYSCTQKFITKYPWPEKKNSV